MKICIKKFSYCFIISEGLFPIRLKAKSLMGERIGKTKEGLKRGYKNCTQEKKNLIESKRH
jgi:hypothetical protein